MKKDNFFWVSYSDLMTSLFFVMLVLFVITIGSLKIKMEENINIIKENAALIDSLKKIQDALLIENSKLKKIVQIEKQFKPLEESGEFYYLPKCKKYIVKDLMGIEIFEPNQTTIRNQYIESTLNAGIIIEKFIQKLNEKNPELSYLLVIEGNMANTYDHKIAMDNKWGYNTSFDRALAVYNLWISNDINFRDYNVEVLICGSGFNGLCRDDIEENNKRFSIQIIPKVQNKFYD